MSRELTAKPARFDELLLRLPGVSPPVVASVLAELARCGYEEAVAPLGTITCESKIKSVPIPGSEQLPPAHPLDFEWRFSQSGGSCLLEHAASLVAGPSSLCLLGTPSLSLLLDRHRSAWAEVEVVDQDTSAIRELVPATERLRYSSIDIESTELPIAPSDVLIMDPPWYDTEMRAFLRCASRSLKLGGYALIVVPPLGTRPGVHDQRAQWIEFGRRVGFRLASQHDGCVEYSMPLFERNAFLASGIRCVPRNWRRGDLVVMRLERPEVLEREPPTVVKTPWKRRVVDGVKIRTFPGCSLPGFGDPRLVSIVGGDVLSTVSRRDNRRDRVQVWTSGNRVFSCVAPHSCDQILRALEGGQEPLEFVQGRLGRDLTPAEEGLVRDATCQIEQVVETERQEQEWYDSPE